MIKAVVLFAIVSLSVLLFQLGASGESLFEDYLLDVDCANLFIF